jgi:CubicO group peptidase (beta-lactamase class C family)
MKSFISSLGAVVIALVCLASPSAQADRVDDVITVQMRERHVPGVALAMIQGSRIIREQSYGFADEEKKLPVTPSTLFQAASVSKPVAALGALHLVEQGKVSLDENINGKLTHWHIPENRFTKDHPVTLRLILSHSAGLTIEGFPGYRVGAPILHSSKFSMGRRRRIQRQYASIKFREVNGVTREEATWSCNR